MKTERATYGGSPAFLELWVRSDEYTPGIVHSTQPLRNADAFSSAFSMQPDDLIWLAPEERFGIWYGRCHGFAGKEPGDTRRPN